ncbi:NAD-dependent histone deacetylase sir2 [Tieghemiomyces parasiticus]|uniref:NAD-dependent histone deacetylase sir2 n=1 Tax=Tieghemiomyces parasiticus TaxID=78921 RepID=A0A9W8DWC7_9FUNG|nr:NAD-dependent histone deacetylase sir2 [Tieghemiomyces parasiticus]
MPVSPRPSGPPTLVAADILTDEEKCFVRSEAKELGLADFMRKYCLEEEVPVRALIAAFSTRLAAELPADRSDSELLPLLSLTVAKYIRHRDRLEYVRTVDDVVDLVRRARKIMVLTGAGVSVSCGIPDFRSPSGIYARLGEFGLDDPQQMFDIEFFTEAPHIFYSFAKELYPSNFVPSPSHHFIRLLESRGQLLRNYTQNIDTLEHQTGIQRVLNCHGSFATASCIRCGHQVPGEAIREDIFAQTVPHCEACARADLLEKMQRPQQKKNRNHRGNANDDDDDTSEGERLPGIMKPDITFFGENLPDVFDRSFAEDHTQVDLLLVIGSSLKVAPVSEVMAHLPANVPQILINKTPNLHMNFDVQLLGDCDDVLAYLCHRLEWDLVHPQLAGGHTLAPEFAELAPTLYRPTEAKAVGSVTAANDNLMDRSTVLTALPAVSDAEQAPSPPPPPPPTTVALPHHWHAFRGATVSPRDLEQAQARYPAQWFD